MKLKTELVEHSPLMCDFDALRHDAAAAHALMRAITIAGDRDPDVSDWIEERADQIMREWGFE